MISRSLTGLSKMLIRIWCAGDFIGASVLYYINIKLKRDNIGALLKASQPWTRNELGLLEKTAWHVLCWPVFNQSLWWFELTGTEADDLCISNKSSSRTGISAAASQFSFGLVGLACMRTRRRTIDPRWLKKKRNLQGSSPFQMYVMCNSNHKDFLTLIFVSIVRIISKRYGHWD